ncbi:HTH DNA binding protein [Mycobacterium phage DS6A]|uniref:Uncharacterized protein n=1 Tax=Mycobacterium phage DS6A TaxID=45764 RepID=G8I4F1_9CAUD|nr:HTH DNA binding protein [Mycobacterium phage DS6A]AER47595.1 hypothetical protein DS6A_41 [Mycobacterium phage DS6A]
MTIAEPNWDARCAAAGARLAEARAAADAALADARDLALRAIAAGHPEQRTARQLGVDRMAVRGWLGKR